MFGKIGLWDRDSQLSAFQDTNLYYLVMRYRGRVLVFTNSVDATRRLYSLLSKLQLKPLMLHARMQEHKRLKNLDRFAEQPDSILLATDVAARGLDIKAVDCVIHYQVPRSAEVRSHLADIAGHV